MIERTEQFEIAVQGRRLCARDVESIREMMRVHPDWTRRRLSLELCALRNWRNEAGRFKDMSCRNLLLKLRDRGLIELPAPTRRPPQSNGGSNWTRRRYAIRWPSCCRCR